MMMIIRKLALATSVAALLAFSADASAETVLNRSIGATIGTLDPQINFLAWEGWVLDDLYEGLVANDAGRRRHSGAAEKWDISDDGLTYTFHLRDGLKWSNGDPLTAQEFVDGIVRTIDPSHGVDKALLSSPRPFASAVPRTSSTARARTRRPSAFRPLMTRPSSRSWMRRPRTRSIVLGSFYAPPLPRRASRSSARISSSRAISSPTAPTSSPRMVPQSPGDPGEKPQLLGCRQRQDRQGRSTGVTEDDSTAVKLWRANELDTTADIPTAQIDSAEGEVRRSGAYRPRPKQTT